MLSIKDLCKQYKTGELVQKALDHVNLDLRDNEFVAILGTSGSGKTTLLNMIGGLDRYDSGDLIINGVSTKQYEDRDWDAYRNHMIGFVFQSYNLIMHQSVLSNVELAMTLSGISKAERRKRALDALDKVGLKEQAHKKPNQMSGGQMQHVAIARALVNEPQIILADEPTGALDSTTSIQIMDILKEVAKDRLVVMVTHNPELAKTYATRIVELKDGQIISDTNPVNMGEIEYITKKEKRTKLDFKTALGLSLNNLMTKKGRTILTAFAGAIGIIGIALILSLSNGVNDYIASIESETMGSYPIELEKETMNLSGMMEQGGPNANSKEEHGKDSIYSDNVVKSNLEASSNTTVENDLGKFKVYLEENQNSMTESLATVEYGYNVSPIALRKDGEDVVTVSPSYLSDLTSTNAMNGFGSTSSVWSQMVSDQNIRETQYELLAGEWPKEKNEIALIISTENEISDYTLYTLGLLDYNELEEMVTAIENDEEYEDSVSEFAYSDVLGLEYQIFAPCELYKEVDGVWLDKSEDEEYLIEQLENGLNVKISAVLRASEEADITSGVAYTNALTQHLIDTTVNSEIVKKQLSNPEMNVLNGKAFETQEDSENTSTNVPGINGSDSTGGMSTLSEDQLAVKMVQMDTSIPSTYEDVLEVLGYCTVDQPSSIALYPIDFEGKEAIEDFIVEYNNQVENEYDKVTYTDMIGTLTSSITSIVNMISYVLIAFVAISLVVSSIMIAIITYISVLERTKEIGVLRALGASKKDVSKIFNAETFIEGFISGVIGIVTTLLLCIPVNSIVYSLTGVDNIASLPMQYSILLIGVSILLTVIAGIIPSRSAAKKDPVIALRSE